eukprot:1255900-Pyramimonas_sp.AAC.1
MQPPRQTTAHAETARRTDRRCALAPHPWRRKLPQSRLRSAIIFAPLREASAEKRDYPRAPCETLHICKRHG